MRKYTLLPILLLVVSLLTISCKKDSGGTIAPNYDGIWTGTTSQGKSISITVSGGTITGISLSCIFSGNCNTSPSGVLINYYTPKTISGNSFSITGTTNISGTFSSVTRASGSFSTSFNGSPVGCSSDATGTWTAGK